MELVYWTILKAVRLREKREEGDKLLQPGLIVRNSAAIKKGLTAAGGQREEESAGWNNQEVALIQTFK